MATSVMYNILSCYEIIKTASIRLPRATIFFISFNVFLSILLSVSVLYYNILMIYFIDNIISPSSSRPCSRPRFARFGLITQRLRSGCANQSISNRTPRLTNFSQSVHLTHLRTTDFILSDHS